MGLVLLILAIPQIGVGQNESPGPHGDGKKFTFASRENETPNVLQMKVQEKLSTFKGSKYRSESVTRNIPLLNDQVVVVVTNSYTQAPRGARIELQQFRSNVALYDIYGALQWEKSYEFPVNQSAWNEEYSSDYYIEAKYHAKAKYILLLVGGYVNEKIPNFFEVLDSSGVSLEILSWDQIGVSGLNSVLHFSKEGHTVVFQDYDGISNIYYCWRLFEPKSLYKYSVGRNHILRGISDSGEITLIHKSTDELKKFHNGEAISNDK